ncbi:MAG: filamentous hemagglutinin family protein, partial [Salinisphaera sp.]|nr:filamentous hemagglutinin family protein [Salinisphaera sp.]
MRAAGNLKLDSNLSDGFDVATPYSSGTTPATLLAGDSWSYRLVAGADARATDPLAVTAGSGDVTLAAGKVVRTGTGDIHIAAGRDIILADEESAIYTAGRIADPAEGFVMPANAQFSQGGGNVSLMALGDIVGMPSKQLYSNWLFRQGKLNDSSGEYTRQPAWWVRFDQFQQGVGALGGGDVTLIAGGKVENVSASTPTQARMTATAPDAGKLVKTGGGNVRVETGGDVLGGQYYADRGELALQVGGKVDSGQAVFGNPFYTVLALGDAQARVQAKGDVHIQTALNPHLVIQSQQGFGGASAATTNIGRTGVRDPNWSLFSTYGENSGVHLQSLNGDIVRNNMFGALEKAYASPLNLGNSNFYKMELLDLLPPGLSAMAFQGDILVQGTTTVLNPSPLGNLTLLAANSVNIPARVIMSDRDPALIPNAINPGESPAQFPLVTVTRDELHLVHAAVPVHTGDTQPARVYAVAGDVQGNQTGLATLDLAKSVRVRAGQDVRDFSIVAQHANAGDLSQVVAGRDVIFLSGNARTDNAKIWVGGLGRLEVAAGRNIDLGTSAGIVSRGDLDNAELPKGGADIHVAAGMGAQGIDYTGAIDRLIAELEKAGASPNEALLWQARWLVGDNALTDANALAAVKAVRALDADAHRVKVRELIYTALLTTGRDFNDPDSPFADDYARGYAALELVFPGIREKNADGSFKNYQGEINLFASRIKTERGGNIEFMAPGGDVIVGLRNTPAVLIDTGNNVLGMLTVADGDVRGFSRGDILVNQSRILTVGGGDILLWSSEGDIDAGKGKKTVTSVPPPVNTTPDARMSATSCSISEGVATA